MSTTVVVKFSQKLGEELESKRGGRADVMYDGHAFSYASGEWILSLPGMLLELPRWVEEFMATHSVVHIVEVRLHKGAGIVGPDDTYRGEYVGKGKFYGCSASVDNYVSGQGPIQIIDVTGPAETYGGYYQRICTRRERPTTWLEPPPRWWRRLLRLW